MVKELRDLDIRKRLYCSKEFLSQKKKDPETFFIDEFGICQGSARVDIAIINGSIHGYEIKSSLDTLTRLNDQVNEYGKVLDTVTLVVSEKHYLKAKDMIPKWWGLIKVVGNREGFKIINKRAPKQNNFLDPFAIAQLLWREEALSILEELGLAKGYRGKPRKQIWEKLVSSLPMDELKFYVRYTIKARWLNCGWRVDVQHKKGDVSSPLFAK